MDTRTVTCPKCGRSFEAGASMEALTCNFCGAVFSPDKEAADGAKAAGSSDFPADVPSAYTPVEGGPAAGADGNDGGASGTGDTPVDTGAEKGPGELFGMAVDALAGAVTSAPKKLSRDSYAADFGRYFAAAEPSFRLLEEAYSKSGDRAALLRDYAAAFASRVKKAADCGDFNQLKGEKLEDTVLLYVAFAVPAAIRYRTEYSDALADELLRTWNGEHKKRRIGKTTFEAINEGFKKKFCFITTAVTEALGRGDDCQELTDLRRFRDLYLLKQPGGEAQVLEYYIVAPLIVRAIESSPRRENIYRDIYSDHIAKCLALLRGGQNSRCRAAYTAMVEKLRSEWL